MGQAVWIRQNDAEDNDQERGDEHHVRTAVAEINLNRREIRVGIASEQEDEWIDVSRARTIEPEEGQLHRVF